MQGNQQLNQYGMGSGGMLHPTDNSFEDEV